jgi:hypothetical protein
MVKASLPGQAFPQTDIFTTSCLFSFVTAQYFYVHVYGYSLSLLTNQMFPIDRHIKNLMLILIIPNFSLNVYGQHGTSPPGQAFPQTDIFKSWCLFSFVTAQHLYVYVYGYWLSLLTNEMSPTGIFRT